jgi:hypothetical protein
MNKGDKNRAGAMTSGGGGAVYGLGLIGAAVFYVSNATGVGEVVLALLKAIVWPAFLVHDLLKYIA